jgi:HK97 gp10 family phage protein
MNFKIEIDDTKLKALLNKMVKKYPEAAKQGMLNTAYMIHEDATRMCSVDTGRLRSSLCVATKEGVLNEQAQNKEDVITPPQEDFEVYIGTRTYYGPFIEFGTRKMPAKPYLRPAFDKNINKLTEEIKKEIERAE